MDKYLFDMCEVIKYFIKDKDLLDWVVVKEICTIVNLVRIQAKSLDVKNIIKSLVFILIKYHGTSDNEWYYAAEEILGLTFECKNFPE